MKNIILNIRARHFKGANFEEPCGCAISNAAKDHFGIKQPNEGVCQLHIGMATYKHLPYGVQEFSTDLKDAFKANFDDTIVRKLKLTLRENHPVIPKSIAEVPKTKTVYVSVPVTITDQAKELVMS